TWPTDSSAPRQPWSRPSSQRCRRRSSIRATRSPPSRSCSPAAGRWSTTRSCGRRGRRTTAPSRWPPWSKATRSGAGPGAARRTPNRRPPRGRSRRSRRNEGAMHLRSITLKGFKSFPDRTRLDFGPGVSVVVGPNGSGKSNITDAVLWALGEQSPLAVRGQSMQDVIFGGARGQQARQHAEVELVLDNADGDLEVDWSEISILRRLDRTGEGEYRMNGARCRLIDVVEALSDTGLGKEMHSVVSQGRVEAVVSSRPRDRRLLVEEAAGLGKHRKRRRRAQLKLERTQENLDRALDVEREARSRLRPLKRQAEATRGERREALSTRSFAARAAHERVGMRLEQARATAAALADRVAAGRARAEALEAEAAADAGGAGDDSRMAELSRELDELER